MPFKININGIVPIIRQAYFQENQQEWAISALASLGTPGSGGYAEIQWNLLTTEIVNDLKGKPDFRRDEIINHWLDVQFQKDLLYCVTCDKFMANSSTVYKTYHQGHILAQTASEITSKQVMARLKGNNKRREK